MTATDKDDNDSDDDGDSDDDTGIHQCNIDQLQSVDNSRASTPHTAVCVRT